MGHPREWRFGGYHELNGTRRRYRVLDLDRLRLLLAPPDPASFRSWYEATLTEFCVREEHRSEPYWSQSFAVGSRTWLTKLVKGTRKPWSTSGHSTP